MTPAMKALAFLIALLLVAFQVQVDAMPAKTEEAGAQETPKAVGNDVPVSFEEAKHLSRNARGVMRDFTCYCRAAGCPWGEYPKGPCSISGMHFTLCCR
ncbi:alpha-defensin 24 [Tupaia chinensis]|uniref:alpha-defensin 24 n=1 Tax=Tupaia chinensis TaxID=246437 RepID=UPI000FFC77BF|nr:alpha-defensin 24 [Tupaia chinensis]